MHLKQKVEFGICRGYEYYLSASFINLWTSSLNGEKRIQVVDLKDLIWDDGFVAVVVL